MAKLPRPLDPRASPAAMFGAELRSCRLGRGLSLARLALLVHVSGDLLGKIEKAERRAQADLVERLDQALEADGLLRRLAADVIPAAGVWEHSDVPLPPEVSAPVLRRIIDSVRDGDHSMNSGTDLSTVVAHAKAAEQATGRVGGDARPELHRTIGEAYQLAGWMSFDQGRPGDAETLLGRARSWAERAADAQLVAFLLGPNLSFIATYGGRPALGVERAYGALGWARRTENHRLIAFTMAIAARAHARLGETALCLELLDHACGELDRHIPRSDDAGWLEVFDQPALDGHRGSCMLDLGLPDRAVTPLRDQSATSRFVRNRVIWQLDRADAHLRLGGIDEACHDVADALDMPGSGSVSRRVVHRFRAIDIQLRGFPTAGPVIVVRERLRELIAANA